MAVLERVVVDGLAQGAAPPGYTHTRSTTGLYIDSDGLLKSAAINTPRRQWDSANRRWGYVGEPSRTNLQTDSENLASSGWNKRGTTTITANNSAAPDGATTADLVSNLGAGAGTTQGLDQNLPLGGAGIAIAASFYIKKVSASGTLKVYNIADNTRGEWTVDLSLVSASWERITATHPAVTVVIAFTSSAASTGGFQFKAASGTLDLYLWGLQLEAGPYPTSYIPTTTGTVSRGADLLTRALTAGEGTALSAQGTMVVEFSFLGGDSSLSASSRRAITVDDGTGSERVYVYNNSGISGLVTDGGATQAVPNVAGTAAVGVVQKCAVTWKLNDVQFARNGSHGTRDTTATMPTVTAIGIGGSSNPGGELGGLVYGWTISDDHYPTDAGMDALTTPTTNRNQSRLTLGLGLGL